MFLFEKKSKNPEITTFCSEKEEMNFEKISKESDAAFESIKSGKTKYNVHDRNLIYAVDYIKWARESFGLFQNLSEERVQDIDKLVAILIQAKKEGKLDDVSIQPNINSVMSLFGVFVEHYLGAIWNEKRENGEIVEMYLILGGKIYNIMDKVRECFNNPSEKLVDYYFKMANLK